MSASTPIIPGGAEADKDAWDAYWTELPEDQPMLRENAGEYVRRLRSAIGLSPETRVLDFGCGFGNVARLLGPSVHQLSLWDDAPRMRRRAMAAVAGAPNVELLDLSTAPHEYQRPRFDLILANSVAQYMTAAEVQTWLRRWRAMLAPCGQIVVSDVVPPDYRAGRDLWIMLWVSARRGFILRALYDAARVMPLYWRTRRARPLLRISEGELRQWAAVAGLTARFLPENFTYFRDRITAVFTVARLPA
jgi:cyclopropane fatty-acyl-phospholipid synthase-like methyltransferase